MPRLKEIQDLEASVEAVAASAPATWRDAAAKHLADERGRIISLILAGKPFDLPELKARARALKAIGAMVGKTIPDLVGPTRERGIDQLTCNVDLARMMTPARWREELRPLFEIELDEAIGQLLDCPDGENVEKQALANELQRFLLWLDNVEKQGHASLAELTRYTMKRAS